MGLQERTMSILNHVFIIKPFLEIQLAEAIQLLSQDSFTL
jgi:hypothetical protein